MALNLITSAWIPAFHRSGFVRAIRPAEVSDPDLVGLALPRPDLNGAVTELLIALLATCAAPADEEAWRAWWISPPLPEELDAAMAPHAPAFELSTFMQTQLDCNPDPIEGLLIDSAGDNTVKENADMLARRGLISAMSPAMAAAAIYARQTYAPQGGPGYFVSIRGGGPMTTILASGRTLWGRLYPNVETRDQIAARAVGAIPVGLEAIYPWLMTRERRTASTPDNANPLHVYWSMPCRIELVMTPGNGEVCSLTGERSEVLVRGYRAENGGIQHSGWKHPFTPYYRVKETEDWLPVRGRLGRIGYRDWLGLVQSTTDDLTMPARVVAHARAQRWQMPDTRLVAYGYASEAAQVLGWSTGEMPIYQVAPDIRRDLESTAQTLVESADLAADALRKAIKRAQGPRIALAGYWEATEPRYWQALGEAARLLATSDADDPVRPVREAWALTLRRAAYEQFNRVCPLDLDYGGNLDRVVAARYRLAQTMRGYGREGQKLCAALGIPAPEKVRTQRKR
jgi:CRISPR system Cascade subunit CasA